MDQSKFMGIIVTKYKFYYEEHKIFVINRNNNLCFTYCLEDIFMHNLS